MTTRVISKFYYKVQLADGVTTVARLYALYSHRARSFNQWQRALYPNFIINLYIIHANAFLMSYNANNVVDKLVKHKGLVKSLSYM